MVSAIVGLSFFGLMPFAGLGLTSVADWIGIRNALFVAAGCYLTVAIPVLIGPGRHIRESPKADRGSEEIQVQLPANP